MNERQKAFSDYFIETNNATDSYKRAYLSCKRDSATKANASKLLTNANIQNYIKERLTSKEAKWIASQDEVLQFFTSVMRGEVPDQLGLESSVRDRVKAAEYLARRYGLLKDNLNIKATVEQIVDDI